jgi:adenine-specific DNA-methyltransferase
MTEQKIQRLNYIGSKFQLLDWIDESIRETTHWNDYTNKRIGDLFSGTGVVSHYFRQRGAVVFSNDAELYSSIISHSLSISSYTPRIQSTIGRFHLELESKNYTQTFGFITKNYSPYDGCERMFFTVDNAQRIDYIRNCIEMIKPTITIDEYKYLIACLLLAADAVSNVPAVYGCYLKNFKAKANKTLTLIPIHTIAQPSHPSSKTYNCNVLDNAMTSDMGHCDFVYLDPPYNERQYSKNYFPLNMIALTPAEQNAQPPLKGKTGIPEGCFSSPFCKKREVIKAFREMFRCIQSDYIGLSYSSEGLLSKEELMEILQGYGEVRVFEREHKRFKSFDYNETGKTIEYLFIINVYPMINVVIPG